MGRSLQIVCLFCLFIFSYDKVSAQSINNIGQNPTELVAEDLKVFPNPTTDYIQISNSTNIKKVVIYNMFGKEVKSYFHYANALHDVSEIKAGMYIVKMLDEKNKVVKSVKLNKTYSGV